MRRLLLMSNLLILALVLPLLVQAQDSGRNRAGIVVQYGDGRVASRCVSFDEEAISGLQLLERAGFGVIAQSYGGAGALVCKIDDVGCNYPAESCTCKCQGADCTYWSYFHLVEGAWHYSAVGASSYRVTHGAVEGWSWGPGSSGRGSAPPVLSFEQVCPAAPIPPSPTATLVPPTATPAPPTAIPPPPPPTLALPTRPARLTATLAAGQAQPDQTQSPTAQPSATLAAQPSPFPTITATLAWSPTAMPARTAVAPASTPSTPTLAMTGESAPATPDAEGGSEAVRGNYIAFAAIALALLGTAVIAARRRAR